MIYPCFQIKKKKTAPNSLPSLSRFDIKFVFLIIHPVIEIYCLDYIMITVLNWITKGYTIRHNPTGTWLNIIGID